MKGYKVVTYNYILNHWGGPYFAWDKPYCHCLAPGMIMQITEEERREMVMGIANHHSCPPGLYFFRNLENAIELANRINYSNIEIPEIWEVEVEEWHNLYGKSVTSALVFRRRFWSGQFSGRSGAKG